MNMVDFLRSLLCGSTVDCSQVVEENTSLRGELEELKEDLSGKEEYIKSLSLSLIECSRQKEDAEADAQRFYAELERALKIVDIGGYVGNRVEVDPWIMTPQQWRGVQPILLSDNSYYAFPEEDWLRILTPIQSEVKRVLGFPKKELVDCDNFSLTMCDAVSLAFMRSGLSKQGAFMKLLSKPHSYCGFMLPDYSVLVYEPMSGVVVGWLGGTGAGDYGEDTYRTEQAYFLA